MIRGTRDDSLLTFRFSDYLRNDTNFQKYSLHGRCIYIIKYAIEFQNSYVCVIHLPESRIPATDATRNNDIRTVSDKFHDVLRDIHTPYVTLSRGCNTRHKRDIIHCAGSQDQRISKRCSFSRTKNSFPLHKYNSSGIRERIGFVETRVSHIPRIIFIH